MPSLPAILAAASARPQPVCCPAEARLAVCEAVLASERADPAGPAAGPSRSAAADEAARFHAEVGAALAAELRIDDALVHLDRAIRLKPDWREARARRAQVLLASGRLWQGWDDYEFRNLEAMGVRPDGRLPWCGRRRPRGEGVLVLAEEDPGTQVLLASCLPDLAADARQVLVECARPLLGLLGRSFPNVAFCRAGDPQARSEAVERLGIECQTAAGSLPGVYRRVEASFPRRRAYLTPDPQLGRAWRSRLDRLGPGIKAGLARHGGCWGEGPSDSPDLDDWRPLLDAPGVHWISLEHGLAGPDPAGDLDGLAALAGQLDLVVGVAGEAVHVAAAAGARTWVLLPYLPGWRWMLGRDDSPWHAPARLFRQPSPGRWDRAIEEAAGELRSLCAARGAQVRPDRPQVRRPAA